MPTIEGFRTGRSAEVDTNGNLQVSLGTGLSASTDSVNVQRGGTPLTTEVSVLATSTALLAANAARRFVRINNTGTTRIWVNYGEAAVVGQGDPIEPGQNLTWEGIPVPFSTLTAISAVAGQAVTIIEL